MKREMLPTLQLARRGDRDAMHVVGRGYLLGLPPLSLDPATGILYLTRAVDAGCADALGTLIETVPLEQLVRYDLLPRLREGATRGLPAAQYKLGLWLCAGPEDRSAGMHWLQRAADAGLSDARRALAACVEESRSPVTSRSALRLLRAETLAGNGRAWAPTAQAALAAGEFRLFAHALAQACSYQHGTYDQGLSDLIVHALVLERQGHIAPLSCPPARLRCALEGRSADGDARAMLLLGRALCGLDEDLRSRADIRSDRCIGRALTLLTTAANAGEVEAWLALADLYARRPRLPFSVVSYRYCLDRAASGGSVHAAVELGRLLLQTSATAQDVQRAVELLYASAARADSKAADLLKQMVLPVGGDDAKAEAALKRVSTRNELLAARLELARGFGLTQHEALTIDISRAARAWGLWVDASAFFTQRSKAMPRAVPITSPSASLALQRARKTFANVDASALGQEGSYRMRVYTMRSVFQRLKIDGSLFFANGTEAKRRYGARKRLTASSLAAALRGRADHAVPAPTPVDPDKGPLAEGQYLPRVDSAPAH